MPHLGLQSQLGVQRNTAVADLLTSVRSTSPRREQFLLANIDIDIRRRRKRKRESILGNLELPTLLERRSRPTDQGLSRGIQGTRKPFITPSRGLLT